MELILGPGPPLPPPFSLFLLLGLLVIGVWSLLPGDQRWELLPAKINETSRQQKVPGNQKLRKVPSPRWEDNLQMGCTGADLARFSGLPVGWAQNYTLRSMDKNLQHIYQCLDIARSSLMNLSSSSQETSTSSSSSSTTGPEDLQTLTCYQCHSPGFSRVQRTSSLHTNLSATQSLAYIFRENLRHQSHSLPNPSKNYSGQARVLSLPPFLLPQAKKDNTGKNIFLENCTCNFIQRLYETKASKEENDSWVPKEIRNSLEIHIRRKIAQRLTRPPIFRTIKLSVSPYPLAYTPIRKKKTTKKREGNRVLKDSNRPPPTNLCERPRLPCWAPIQLSHSARWVLEGHMAWKVCTLRARRVPTAVKQSWAMLNHVIKVQNEGHKPQNTVKDTNKKSPYVSCCLLSMDLEIDQIRPTTPKSSQADSQLQLRPPFVTQNAFSSGVDVILRETTFLKEDVKKRLELCIKKKVNGLLKKAIGQQKEAPKKNEELSTGVGTMRLPQTVGSEPLSPTPQVQVKDSKGLTPESHGQTTDSLGLNSGPQVQKPQIQDTDEMELTPVPQKQDVDSLELKGSSSKVQDMDSVATTPAPVKYDAHFVELNLGSPVQDTDSMGPTPGRQIKNVDSGGLILGSQVKPTDSKGLIPRSQVKLSDSKELTSGSQVKRTDFKGLTPRSQVKLTDSKELTSGSQVKLTDFKGLIPGSQVKLTDSKGLIPGSQFKSTDSKEMIPGSQVKLTDSKEMIPESQVKLTDSKGLIPGSQFKFTDSKGLIPGTKVKLTDSKGLIPGSEVKLTDSKQLIPGLQFKLTDSKGLAQGSQVKFTDSKEVISGSQVKLTDSKGLAQGSQVKVIDSKGLIPDTQVKLTNSKGLAKGSQVKLTGSKGLIPESQVKLTDSKGLIPESQVKLRDSKGLAQGSQVKVIDSKGLIPESQLKLTDSKGLTQRSQVKLTDSKGLAQELQVKLRDSKGLIPESQVKVTDSKGLAQGSQVKITDSKGLAQGSQVKLRDSKGLAQGSQVKVKDSKGLAQGSQVKVKDSKGLAQGSQVKVTDSKRLILESQVKLSDSKGLAQESQVKLTDSKELIPESQVKLTDSKGLAQESQVKLTDSKDLIPESQVKLTDSKGLAQRSQVKLTDSKGLIPESQVKLTDAKEHALGSQVKFTDSKGLISESQVKSTDSKGLIPGSQVKLTDPKGLIPESQVKLTHSKGLAQGSQIKFTDSKGLAQKSQVKLTDPKGLIPESQAKLTDSKGLAQGSQIKFTDSKGLAQESQVKLTDPKGLIPESHVKLTHSKGVVLGSQVKLRDSKGLIPESQVKPTDSKGLIPGSQVKLTDSKRVVLGSQVKLRDSKGLIPESQVKPTDSKGLIPGSQVKLTNSKGVAQGSQVKLTDSKGLALGSQVKLTDSKRLIPGSQVKLTDSKGLAQGSQVKPTDSKGLAQGSQIKLRDSKGLIPESQVKLTHSKGLAQGLQVKVTDSNRLAQGSQVKLTDSKRLIPGSQVKLTNSQGLAQESQVKLTDSKGLAQGSQIKFKDSKVLSLNPHVQVIDSLELTPLPQTEVVDSVELTSKPKFQVTDPKQLSPELQSPTGESFYLIQGSTPLYILGSSRIAAKLKQGLHGSNTQEILRSMLGDLNENIVILKPFILRRPSKFSQTAQPSSLPRPLSVQPSHSLQQWERSLQCLFHDPSLPPSKSENSFSQKRLRTPRALKQSVSNRQVKAQEQQISKGRVAKRKSSSSTSTLRKNLGAKMRQAHDIQEAHVQRPPPIPSPYAPNGHFVLPRQTMVSQSYQGKIIDILCQLCRKNLPFKKQLEDSRPSTSRDSPNLTTKEAQGSHEPMEERKEREQVPSELSELPLSTSTQLPSSHKIPSTEQNPVSVEQNETPDASSQIRTSESQPIPLSITSSHEQTQLLQDLQLKITEELLKNQLSPHFTPSQTTGMVLQYPICLQCGRCSGPSCPHKFHDSVGPWLVIYPQLRLFRNSEGHGEFRVHLGFRLRTRSQTQTPKQQREVGPLVSMGHAPSQSDPSEKRKDKVCTCHVTKKNFTLCPCPNTDLGPKPFQNPERSQNPEPIQVHIKRNLPGRRVEVAKAESGEPEQYDFTIHSLLDTDIKDSWASSEAKRILDLEQVKTPKENRTKTQKIERVPRKSTPKDRKIQPEERTMEAQEVAPPSTHSEKSTGLMQWLCLSIKRALGMAYPPKPSFQQMHAPRARPSRQQGSVFLEQSHVQHGSKNEGKQWVKPLNTTKMERKPERDGKETEAFKPLNRAPKNKTINPSRSFLDSTPKSRPSHRSTSPVPKCCDGSIKKSDKTEQTSQRHKGILGGPASKQKIQQQNAQRGGTGKVSQNVRI
uniref:Uncharacterized protein C2orf16 homolog isoform X1 n=2 Tax=Phascolarctos cinereus TaxID=38626 RepID=A0A6P5K3S3_PHACI|nr:uncharacterized protein C2orf16 homolog isoform X1 [Phascolarctos cinereus]XP_020839452.1 uncharacterized protein C2orf16 homolog isoform X1 [Phascolarctos cinereus]